MVTSPIDTLLLLALPASGKSELRRYLGSVERGVALADFGLGPTVQLDDYPYVHMMRRIDEELRSAGAEAVFFDAHDQPFRDGHEWATLIHLLNEDYAALGTSPTEPTGPGRWLLDRIDRARRAAGLPARFGTINSSVTTALDAEAAELAAQRTEALSAYEPDTSTVLIEFARGGPADAEPPLSAPHGYAFSLGQLSGEILRRASAVYVWVTPEESRRRNAERAQPGPDGDASILFHGVPETVMLENYGTDDFLWMLDEGSLEVESGTGRFRVPGAVFDNRVDRTSFLRDDPEKWDAAAVRDLHAALVGVFAQLRD